MALGTVTAQVLDGNGVVISTSLLSQVYAVELSQTIGTSVTVDGSTSFMNIDCTSAAQAIALPAALDYVGYIFFIRKADATANLLTITPNGSDTINAGASLIIGSPRSVVRLVCVSATEWAIS